MRCFCLIDEENYKSKINEFCATNELMSLNMFLFILKMESHMNFTNFSGASVGRNKYIFFCLIFLYYFDEKL